MVFLRVSPDHKKQKRIEKVRIFLKTSNPFIQTTTKVRRNILRNFKYTCKSCGQITQKYIIHLFFIVETCLFIY